MTVIVTKKERARRFRILRVNPRMMVPVCPSQDFDYVVVKLVEERDESV